MLSNLLDIEKSLLLIIDVQDKLLAAQPKAEKILKNTLKLAQAAKILDLPVIATEQYPKGLGGTNEQIKEQLNEAADFFEKTSFDCCLENGFNELLKSTNRNQIIICGVEAHICVHQTANSLLRQGYEVHIIQDAVGSRNKWEYKKGLQRMFSDGAIPTCVETGLFELLKTAKNTKFKEIQALIK